MTFTDEILTKKTKRKRIHIDELHYATYERDYLLTSSVNLGSDYLKNYKYADGIDWDIDYPKADKKHHPPNESPDNEFKTRHIQDIRNQLLPDSFDTPYEIGASGWAHPTDDYFRPIQIEYGNYFPTINGICFDPYTLALGTGYNGYNKWQDETLTSSKPRPPTNNSRPRVPHIMDLRKVISQKRRLLQYPIEIQARYKYKALGAQTCSREDFWNMLKLAFSETEWSEWGTLELPTDNNTDMGWWINIQGIGDNEDNTDFEQFSGLISATEHKYIFNPFHSTPLSDIKDLNGNGWNPLIYAKSYAVVPEPYCYSHLYYYDTSTHIYQDETIPDEFYAETSPGGIISVDEQLTTIDGIVQDKEGSKGYSVEIPTATVEEIILRSKNGWGDDALEGVYPDVPYGNGRALKELYAKAPTRIVGVCSIPVLCKVIEPNFRYYHENNEES